MDGLIYSIISWQLRRQELPLRSKLCGGRVGAKHPDGQQLLQTFSKKSHGVTARIGSG
jgi:hypothetical protein